MISSIYLREDVAAQMREALRTQNVLLLDNFFTDECYKELRSQIGSLKGKEIYVPHKNRFVQLDINFESKELISFLSDITEFKLKKVKLDGKRFDHQSFTLLHDDSDVQDKYLFFYFIADNWQPEWGGQTVFTHGDGTEPLVFNVKGNSLVLIKTKGMRDFVKYVNHFAKNKNFVKVEGKL